MNVHKMLNLFILIFLLINAVLFYYIDKQEADAYKLSRDREVQLTETFSKYNMAYYAFLPEYYPRARLVILSPNDRENQLVEIIFRDEKAKMSLNSSAHIHETDYEKLTFKQEDEKGRVFYGATVPQYVPRINDNKGYIEIVREFVTDFTFEAGSYEVTDTRTRTDENFIIYFFNEVFKGELLFSNEVVVRLDEGVGVTEARAIRYEPYSYEEAMLPLVEVDEVLYKFMYWITEETDRQIIITDVDIGYYIGVDSDETFVSKIIEPHYRIKLNSGETYYFNAYTNEMVR